MFTCLSAQNVVTTQNNMNQNNNNNKKSDNAAEIRRIFLDLTQSFQKSGLSVSDLEATYREKSPHFRPPLIPILLLSLLTILGYNLNIHSYFLGIRCLIPNNYFVWEATRPLSDCHFCVNVTQATVLNNCTREEFQPYAYSSKPMVVKSAFLHWPAIRLFDFHFFRDLYERVPDSHKSVDEECQFLHFKSNFISIRDVFAMSEQRIRDLPGEKSWYVGWGNCHPVVLQEMRKFYPKPHFLPEDCEIPSKEYVFMGYDDGATMHLDFINRLMWQAQLKGTKTWHLMPPPECEEVCSKFSFVVEPGDAVLVDTRVWYHGTTIVPGEFSLSIQSEYG